MTGRLKKLKSNLKGYLELASRLRSDKRVPAISKFLLGAAVAYALSPIDIVPDFIPVLGHLDDVLIVGGLVFLAVKLIRHEVFREHYRQVFGTDAK